MNTLPDKPIIFLGDHHGAWNEVQSLINVKNIENCNLISVGDIGIGFNYTKEREYKICEHLNQTFKKLNINFYGIRGNHDNPSYFKGLDRVVLSNFELFEDCSVYTYNDKTIQFIGGAVSIDRTGRQDGVSYWEDERVFFQKDLLQKVDILVTHTAPSYCFPQTFNEMVYGWAREDAYLLEDLNDERAVMDEIFKICNPKHHFYGHFHSSWSEKINNCTHRLLNINELFEYREFNSN
jgi:DNA repair exonuclease SbcCD nuclease subunit